MGYSIEEIKEVIGGKDASVVNHPKCVIEHLTMDSRKISFAASSLFFAIKTATRDGQEFVMQAYQQGIRNFVIQGAIHEELKSILPEVNVLVVDETVTALQTLAAFHRRKFNYPVIGITGSNGKTIVKEWLNFLLEDKYRIVRSPRSFNSQIGVPLSVWEMDASSELGIFEAGISTTNEMLHLENVIAPSIGVLTSIGDAHDSGFNNKLQKLREKLILFKRATVLFYSSVEEWVINEVERFQREVNAPFKLIRIGADENADVQINAEPLTERNGIMRLTAKVKTNAKDDLIKVQIPISDQASIHNAGICLAVINYLRIDAQTCVEKMAKLPVIDMRLQVLPAINGCTIINDSYSLDQHSLQVALDLLNQQLLDKTLILSDIPGLKDGELESAYTEMAALIQHKNLGRLITIGPVWKRFGCLLKALPKTEQYGSTTEFIERFQLSQFKAEAILLKGARSFLFEDIFHLLQEKVHQTRLEISLPSIIHTQKNL